MDGMEHGYRSLGDVFARCKKRECQQSVNEWTVHHAVTSKDLDSLLDNSSLRVAWYDRVEPFRGDL